MGAKVGEGVNYAKHAKHALYAKHAIDAWGFIYIH